MAAVISEIVSVVLSADPHTVSPDTIKDIKVVRTVTGGKTVYQA